MGEGNDSHTAMEELADSEYRRGVRSAELGEEVSVNVGHWFSRGFAWMSAMLDRQRLKRQIEQATSRLQQARYEMGTMGYEANILHHIDMALEALSPSAGEAPKADLGRLVPERKS